jgi:hypothetical protein
MDDVVLCPVLLHAAAASWSESEKASARAANERGSGIKDQRSGEGNAPRRACSSP